VRASKTLLAPDEKSGTVITSNGRIVSAGGVLVAKEPPLPAVAHGRRAAPAGEGT
jgi:hypothetical protein